MKPKLEVNADDGVWRSWLARAVWDREVEGSSPFTPTTIETRKTAGMAVFCYDIPMNTLIFGYGSLIGLSSTQATAPEVKKLRAAYIRNYTRSFSLHDPVGYTDENLDVANIPFCGLDVQPSSNPEDRVNGVVFAVNDVDLQAMLIREQEYETPMVAVFDFATNEQIGKAMVFSACKNNGSYDQTNPAQVRYLEDMLAGAKSFGEEFYQEFIQTTYIGDKSLAEMPDLIK